MNKVPSIISYTVISRSYERKILYTFIQLTSIYTRVLKIRPSFWFGPQVFVAYANKNVAILFEFQTDTPIICL